jgi:ribosomal subunit interface protein
MDIVVKGRNVEVPEHYRVHVLEKLDRLERYDRKLLRCDVELFHEPNRRQHKSCQRVEITTKVRGQAVRAEASAGDFYAALDAAAAKLESRLRRMHDRRRVHYGRRSPASVGQATGGALPVVGSVVAESGERSNGQPLAASTALLEEETYSEYQEAEYAADAQVPEQRWPADDGSDEYQPGRVVRDKEHDAKPMTVEDALYQMELVGHDFYLFSDANSGQPSVVYRRKGFDYGVIRLR